MAATGQETEHRVLLELAKEAFEQQVAKRVRPLSSGFVERWMKGEFWLHPDVVRHHATELRAYKPVVLEVLRATSVDEIPAICRRTRPDLTYPWHDPVAKARLTKEIDEAIKAVQTLCSIPPTQDRFHGGEPPKSVAWEKADDPAQAEQQRLLGPLPRLRPHGNRLHCDHPDRGAGAHHLRRKL